MKVAFLTDQGQNDGRLFTISLWREFRIGWVPLESDDGQYLYYITTQNLLWKLPLAGGEETQVLSDLAPLGSCYALGKQGIYFIRVIGGGQELAFLSFATGQISPIVTLPRSVTFGLALSPDLVH